MSLERHNAGHENMELLYCRHCEEDQWALPSQVCEACEEPLMSRIDAEEAAWEAAQERAWDMPTLDEQHRLAWEEKRRLRS